MGVQLIKCEQVYTFRLSYMAVSEVKIQQGIRTLGRCIERFL